MLTMVQTKVNLYIDDRRDRVGIFQRRLKFPLLDRLDRALVKVRV